MELLDSYLKTVRRSLPKAQQDDIIQELSEEVRSQIEEKEAELGRPLNEGEQVAILKQHGDPMVAADRYRKDHRSVAFGWQLIGSELFPSYLMHLGFNIGITVLIFAIFGIIAFVHGQSLPQIGHWVFGFPGIALPVFIQLVVVTLVYAVLDFCRRKFPQPWLFPPTALTPLQPIARWQSVSGLIVWGVFTTWWAYVPHFPYLIFGSAAAHLRLTPGWERFYLPILLLLLAGIAQRGINFVRPYWTWLLPVTRVAINVIGLALQYPMAKSYPFVAVADATKESSHYGHLAQSFNAIVLWGVLSWFWIYLLIDAVVYAWLCVPHVRRWVRRHREPVPSRA
jgi:hypothetical protein